MLKVFEEFLTLLEWPKNLNRTDHESTNCIRKCQHYLQLTATSSAPSIFLIFMHSVNMIVQTDVIMFK